MPNGDIVVKNPFYEISFTGSHINIDFVKMGKKAKFYYTNSIRAGTMRIHLLKNKNTAKEIESSPDGKKATLIFSDECKSESYDIESEIKFTFSNDNPIIKYEASLKQKEPFKRYSIALNKFWFGEETTKEMPFYAGGNPYCENKISDRRGGLAPGNWKNKYRYFCMNDKENALGIISGTEQNSYIYADEKQKGGNLSGCDVESWNTETFAMSQYIYAGPLGEKAEHMAKWAEKLYK